MKRLTQLFSSIYGQFFMKIHHFFPFFIKNGIEKAYLPTFSSLLVDGDIKLRTRSLFSQIRATLDSHSWQRF